jgi:hypothetical protein
MPDKANKRDFNCFPQFHKGCFHLPLLAPTARRPARQGFSAPPLLLAATPFQPNRYKVIIRIRLSAGGRRYIASSMGGRLAA